MPPPLPEAPSSPLSSPDSFVTATASPPELADGAGTDGQAPDNDGAQLEYRRARHLPPELKHHCQIYLEENLHQTALRLLQRLHASGGAPAASNGPPQKRSNRMFCPPPAQLALLNTITVHPDLTTRPREAGWVEASASALDYLRDLLANLGPIHAGFREAFRFGSAGRRAGSTSPAAGDAEYDFMGVGSAQLYGRYAKQSVWRRGQDFFSVVGWAFNCSVLYPNRWEYWRQWLDFMIDVLEADLTERARLDEEEHVRSGSAEGHCAYPLLNESILAGYVHQRSGRSGGLKWIIKAIFADGSGASNSLFQEVWHKEHKGISRDKVLKRKRGEVNIEKGEFGGLLDDDSIYSSQNSEPPTPQKRRTWNNKHEFRTLEPAYVESILLRQRLFVQLSFLCNYLPEPPIDLPDLYETYESSVRSLPLSIFPAFIDSTTSVLRDDSQITVLQNMLELLMPSSAVQPEKVDRARYDEGGTSPAILERCFLPYAANTIAAEDNAKVSILLEELVQLIWGIGTQPFSDGLAKAVAKGVQAREAKIQKKVTGTRGRRSAQAAAAMEDPDAEAKALLSESSKRLTLLAELIRSEAVEMDEDMA
jgi:hypothetical protein